MPVKINSSASINYAIPIVSSLVFSMHNGKLVGPIDGFGTSDWDYIRTIAVKRAIAMRSQGFVHPATLVPSELEYAEGYRARMSVLWSKMRPIPSGNASKQFQKLNQSKPQQHKRTSKIKTSRKAKN
jgi:fructose 1,6-bisphosphate aldolase/phosphatase